MKRYFIELNRLRPFLFSTFYQRAKLVQMRPRPVRAFLNLEITRTCCFQCDFCLASKKTGGPEHLPLKMAKKTLELFEGVERVVLLGGEPLMHPDLESIIEAASAIGAKTEIYTNGMLLGDKAQSVKNRCEQLGALNPHGIIITLAMDSKHASQLGKKRLEAILQGSLSAQEQKQAESKSISVRFNVTDERISTSDYLSPNLVLEILEEIHPWLAQELKLSISDGSLSERFLFNTVVRMGRAEDPEYMAVSKRPPELIRAVDLVKGLEFTAAMNQNQGISLYPWLNAMWIEPGPDSFSISKIDPGEDDAEVRGKLKKDFRDYLGLRVFGLDEKTFASVDTDSLMIWLLGESKNTAKILAILEPLGLRDPSLGPALALLKDRNTKLDEVRLLFSNALLSRHRWQLLAAWHDGDAARTITKPILNYLKEDHGPALNLSSSFRFCQFPLEVLKELVKKYHQIFPERNSYLTGQLLNALAKHSGQIPVVFETGMEQSWDYAVEAAKSLVDTGISVIDGSSAVRLFRADLLAWPGRGLELDFPALDFRPGSEETADRSWDKLLDLLAAVLPSEQRAYFASAFCKESDFVKLPYMSQGRIKRWKNGVGERKPNQDPVRIFESLTYEPNADYLPWDDIVLASMVKNLGLPGWTEEEIRVLLKHFHWEKDTFES